MTSRGITRRLRANRHHAAWFWGNGFLWGVQERYGGTVRLTPAKFLPPVAGTPIEYLNPYRSVWLGIAWNAGAEPHGLRELARDIDTDLGSVGVEPIPVVRGADRSQYEHEHLIVCRLMDTYEPQCAVLIGIRGSQTAPEYESLARILTILDTRLS